MAKIALLICCGFLSQSRSSLQNWIGRKIWVFGGAAFDAGDYVVYWNPSLPAQIIDIKGMPNDAEVGNAPPVWAAWCGSKDWPECHLDVILKLPPHATYKKLELKDDFNGDNLPGITANSYPKEVPEIGHLHLAKVQDLWQYAATEGPQESLRGQSPRILRAFKERRLVKGMPRRLVIRLVGFPYQMVESYEALMKDSDWYFSFTTPFGYQIKFDRSGRLVQCEYYGNLP